MSDVYDDNLKFIQDNLEYIAKYTDMVSNGQITPDRLNFALSKITGIANWLTSEYERTKIEAESVEEEFQMDWDTWYLDARAKLRVGRPASQTVSDKEAEAKVRTDNRFAYLEWTKKVKTANMRQSYFRRLCDNWKKQSDVVINLCWNSRSELKSLTTENFANGNVPGQVRKTKVKRDQG